MYRLNISCDMSPISPFWGLDSIANHTPKN